MADFTLEGNIQWTETAPYKVELTRGQRGAYGWTVTVRSAHPALTVNELERIDKRLRELYITSQEEHEEV